MMMDDGSQQAGWAEAEKQLAGEEVDKPVYRLSKVRVKNFKAIESCEIDLTNVTLLVGTNNSGKSSILQALHFGATLLRIASEANKQSTLSLTAADFVPSENYKKLSHGNTEWGNAKDTPESEFGYVFENQFGEQLEAKIVVKAARNEGLSLTPAIPNQLFDALRDKNRFFTAYIPGLAGIPLRESYVTKRPVFKKVASGDSNVVLRNILYMIKNNGEIEELISSLQKIYPDFSINVEFSEENDHFIDCTIESSGDPKVTKPLEYAGTGMLQVIQIFAYLILFKPDLLLIDEPESHLHPTLQIKLVQELYAKAKALDAIAMITTHSPFIAKGLPAGSRTVWIDNGKVSASTTGEEIRNALGWGAIDRKILLCTEDKNSSYLERILSQKPDLMHRVAVVPFEGVSKLGSATPIRALRKTLGNAHEVVVHRDRDCYVGDELDAWRSELENKGLRPFITRGCDIEAYFCEPEYIATALGIPLEQAKAFVDSALEENEASLKSAFTGKRQDINKRLYEKRGGSPSTDELWKDLPILERVKGKEFISKIRDQASKEGHDEKCIGKLTEGHRVAGDLIDALNELLD